MYKVHKIERDNAWVINEVSKELTQLKLIKFHPEYGNFYAFNSIHAMPHQRKLMFDLVQQHNSIGMDKEELKNEMKEIMQMLEKKEQGYEMKIYKKASTIDQIATDFWDYRQTSLLICSLCIIHESDLDLIGVFDQEKAQKYINEWAKDEELLSFFLTITQKLCNNLINKFHGIFPTFLVEHPPVESQISITDFPEQKSLIIKLKNLLTKLRISK
jgi:hypothetical protein